MQPTHHPDDERLAALAGGELDDELRAHVRDCAQCRSVVDELTTLRAALAELPDLIPSRPMRLLPEVAEPQPTAAERLADWTRRAFMPVLAAGFGLVIIGSVGTAGTFLGQGAAGGAAVSEPQQFRDQAASPASSAALGAAEGAGDTAAGAPAAAASASSSPAAERAEATSASPAPEPVVKALEQPPASTPRSLWPMVLFAGVALIVATLLLRWIVQPRAG